MASKFCYYRPRGIEGNYIVQVVLDLAETETGEVWVARYRDHHCGSCGRQTPRNVQVLPNESYHRAENFIIGNIVVGDTIKIVIRDENVVPEQQTRHIANAHGFTHEALPFSHGSQRWKVVPLNLLYLYDLDYATHPFARLGDKPSPVRLALRSSADVAQVETQRQEVSNPRALLPASRQVAVPGNTFVLHGYSMHMYFSRELQSWVMDFSPNGNVGEE